MKHYKTIVLSDIHLGTKSSKAKEIVRFLQHHTFENLILNGDIIDGWQLKRFGSWKRKHTNFFKLVFRALEKPDIKVIYVRGNHDDFLDEIMPFEMGNFQIVRDYKYESFGKKYYVCHGDIFDRITTNLKWVAKLGDIGYTFLLWLNRKYNNYRTKRGLPYYSLSQAIKHKVKQAVSYINDFEVQLSKVGRIEKCGGVICGHIHTPAVKMIDGILYLNSGDWVESLTALVEEPDGEWKIIYYEDWKKEIEDIEEETEQDKTAFQDFKNAALLKYCFF